MRIIREILGYNTHFKSDFQLTNMNYFL